MNTRRKFFWVITGLWAMAAPVASAQTLQPANTNSPASPVSLPPLPPLPAPLAARLATSPPAQRAAVFQLVTNGEGKQVIARMTNPPVQPIQRPPYTVSPTPNRPLAPPPVQKPFPLVLDSDIKEYTAKPGETNAQFSFLLTNNSPSAVTINEVRTSCGCTVAKLPSQPWLLTPGTNGEVHVTVDLRGKRGQITKLVYVYGDFATKTLTVKVNIPEAPLDPMAGRARNVQIASADRQAVFKNDCAKCHVEPTVGKKGEALFAAACAICHESDHRASMVPDLRNLNHSTDRIYWKVWTSQGKTGSLMPAFAQSEGGPLTKEQIDSLADYLAEHIPSRPVAKLPASQ